MGPPHSYIDIKDFSSFKEFADYIVRVSEDDALFASFFWWKQFYRTKKCENRNGMEIFCYDLTQAYCKLCAKLHQNPSEQKIITDIKSWVTQSQCTTKKDFFSRFYHDMV